MKLKSILIAGLFAAVSSASAWAEDLTANVSLVPGPLNLSAGFSLTHAWSGAFTDTINIGPAIGPSTVEGSLITIGMGAANIDFLSATLNGNALSFTATPGGYAEAGIRWPTAMSGPLTLVVHGIAGIPNTDRSRISASYAGTVNVYPVPEPETYAMMLGGLGLLAFVASRRKA